ncbi:hypothetical protein Tco_0501865, partial [Tanacetum coccineum]
VGTIWRIQGIGYGILEFLGVGTMHGYAVSSLMDTAYWLSKLLIFNISSFKLQNARLLLIFTKYSGFAVALAVLIIEASQSRQHGKSEPDLTSHRPRACLMLAQAGFHLYCDKFKSHSDVLAKSQG